MVLYSIAKTPFGLDGIGLVWTGLDSISVATVVAKFSLEQLEFDLEWLRAFLTVDGLKLQQLWG